MKTELVSYSIITPEKVFDKGEAHLVVVPGADGDLGVMPRMSPLISELRSGTVVLFDSNRKAQRHIFVSGGVVEVSPNELVVLASSAENIEDVDPIALQVSISQANAKQKASLEELQKIIAHLPYS